jgi:hypothetical protein
MPLHRSPSANVLGAAARPNIAADHKMRDVCERIREAGGMEKQRAFGIANSIPDGPMRL